MHVFKDMELIFIFKKIEGWLRGSDYFTPEDGQIVINHLIGFESYHDR